jgi:hypothetical protein
MNKPIIDAGIPLLTEIIAPIPADNLVARVGAKPGAASWSSQREGAAPQEMREVNGGVDGERNRLERQISERVLQQMLGRVDFVLEQRVRDSLANVLQTAVEGLAADIRQGLQQTLEEVIARAVSQEISRLQTNRK